MKNVTVLSSDCGYRLASLRTDAFQGPCTGIYVLRAAGTAASQFSKERDVMRVLWICNIMLPRIAVKLGQEVNNKEGWITGLLDAVLHFNEAHPEEEVQLGVAFPVGKGQPFLQDALVVHENYDIPFYGFREDTSMPEQYDMAVEQDMVRIFEHFKPDMIHCFGTEYPHTLAAVKSFGRRSRTLVGVQGLCRVCAGAYMANLPQKVQRSVTFRDLVKQDTLLKQQQKFEDRGQWELAAIQGTGHVTGRTEWDRYWTCKWNPGAEYHALNETLRKEFYLGQWSLEHCEPHRLFFSQGDYPLKGLHYMLSALPKILEKYPDARVYVAGNSLLRSRNLQGRLKISAYGVYLEKLISRYGLEGKVHFLGKLTAEEMKAQYLKCQAFVCASSMENSPNSMGEAMLLGTPVVTSYVGGIPTILKADEGTMFDGFCVERAEEEEELARISDRLAEAVCQVFGDIPSAIQKAARAKAHALKTHNAAVNNDRLIEIYKNVTGKTE